MICQAYEGVTDLNVVAFTSGGVGDVWANLLAIKDIVNVKKTEDLFCFVSNDEKEDKVLLGITDFMKEQLFQPAFWDDLVYNLSLWLL